MVPYKSKGKARAKFNAEWDAERTWLLEKLREFSARSALTTIDVECSSCLLYIRGPGLETELRDIKLAEELRQKEVEESGEGIECGCCFGTAPFEKCVQCNDGHLFWSVPLFPIE